MNKISFLKINYNFYRCFLKACKYNFLKGQKRLKTVDF
ncbi:MAG: hypothetical protein AVDCRST_MAG96-562 [uncultured Segetibacter sp.]|uniref:Uncharacterized protein n=1 Tax=uncultured Segetibacter sp. TaxID=481133 RepID=A0A6J4RQB8_9BACT|nr:MAG: hypothetical protein AVDCRST_MAG96-562 [uncultured Segetibacter sp.]